MIPYEELMKKVNILLVDDDKDYINIAEVYLKMRGYHVNVVNCGKDAVETIRKHNHQIVLLDYFMDDMSGAEVVEAVREFDKEVIIILQTGFSGQKPPIETMQKLNIQNYYDKTDGMERLNLEIISAVKIFNQQNEIAISNYKTTAIGSLISNIVGSIKSNLVNISAGMEITNLFVNGNEITAENAQKLNNYYTQNKECLENIDRVLTSVVKQSQSQEQDVLSDTEIIETLQLILLSSSIKEKNITLEVKSSLRSGCYISGKINDVVFTISDIVSNILKRIEPNSRVSVILTEDEGSWYFKIDCSCNIGLGLTDINFYKSVLTIMVGTNLEVEDKKISLQIEK